MLKLFLLGFLFVISYGYRIDRLRALTKKAQEKEEQEETGPMAIVGGYEAFEGAAPWQVSFKNSQYNHFCGGSLVKDGSGKIVVVTAAHCVEGATISDLRVVVGRHSISNPSSHEKTFTVLGIKMHPKYDGDTLVNDIAIVTVQGAITEDADMFIQAIQLSNRKAADFNKYECMITGWGSLQEGGGGPDALQEAWVDLFTTDYCINKYGNQFYRDVMICAGKTEGGIDSCQGDSGGPFVCEDPDNYMYTLVGVVSWGTGCARADKPGVYADVQQLRPWLNKELGL